MKRLKLLSLFLIISYFSFSQDYQKRYSFAKAYFGIDAVYTPSYGTSQYLNSNDNIENYERQGFLTPAINIGATHFWGYADFYVSITTAAIQPKPNELKTQTDYGVFTGLRVYPLQLNENSLQPYIGYKFSPFRYKQSDIKGSSSKKTMVKSVLDAGIGYRTSKFYFYAGYNRVLSPTITTFISRTDNISTTLPNHFLNIGANWMIETTRGSNNPINRHFNDIFSASNKNGLFIGIGPSAAFPIGSSEYITTELPFLDDKAMPRTYPDLAIGYHFTKTDFATALAFRPITQVRKAFDFEQKINRNSISLEAYKMIGDYHGFVPFVGIGVGYEHLNLTEYDKGLPIKEISLEKLTPLIVFGWDIRPSKKGDAWLLRTNLRYSPALDIAINDKRLSLQHLEFNFIQFVMYPQRMKRFKEYQSK